MPQRWLVTRCAAFGFAKFLRNAPHERSPQTFLWNLDFPNQSVGSLAIRPPRQPPRPLAVGAVAGPWLTQRPGLGCSRGAEPPFSKSARLRHARLRKRLFRANLCRSCVRESGAADFPGIPHLDSRSQSCKRQAIWRFWAGPLQRRDRPTSVTGRLNLRG